MKIILLIRNQYVRFLINVLYAACNCVIGFYTHSWWFLTVGAYYSILATTRLLVLQVGQKSKDDYDTELFVKRITGVLLIILSFCIVGMNILSALKDRGKVFHEIIMITIAVYAFSKITIAIIGMVKAKCSRSPVKKTLRNLSLADAFVSIYSMQRSMLVSFPGMSEQNIWILNFLTGTAVWIIVFLLGANLIGGKYIIMAKSKIVKGIDKTAQVVTGGYKKIEQAVVHGYTKIEDKFVEAYLKKDGETVEEAKERLKKKK